MCKGVQAVLACRTADPLGSVVQTVRRLTADHRRKAVFRAAWDQPTLGDGFFFLTMPFTSLRMLCAGCQRVLQQGEGGECVKTNPVL